MRIGFIGAGSMAGALARGIGEPALFTSGSGERARSLATELGGEAAASNADLCERADVVFLGFKPKHLDDVAPEAGAAKVDVSLLAATPIARLEETFPDRPVYRLMTSIPSEIGAGPILLTRGGHTGPDQELIELLGRAGDVVEVAEDEIDPGVGLMGSGPAFLARIVEAFVDAGVAQGLERDRARRLATDAMAASAAYIAASDYDPAILRTRVATPGGLTEKGLELLDERGVGDAIGDTVALLVEASRA